MRVFLSFVLFVASSVSAFVRPGPLGSVSKTKLNLAQDPKVVLITGSSQGLGKAMALDIAKHGHKIVVNFYPGCDEAAQETVEEIVAVGGDGIAIAADCTNFEQVEKMFDQAFDHYGTVDVVVNNAGITKDNLVPRMKPKDFAAVINVNLSGDFYVCKAFLNAAAKTDYKGGRIINIASVVGQIGNPGQANYAASKGGVIGFTKALAKEVAADNIKVNAICPGFIETPMTAKLTDEQLQKSVDAIPLHRLGQPEEVAAMVRFLAIDEGADYITGHCFDVDGGVGIAAS
ncbi:Diacetyl reductase [(S)-acetoin forming] [Seminavis robusta]|uniref:3-oxoacyl-[acyl-carrier-protein] reductase n=1 Tax=Seminavis robusta TaxID=568900 RepID=A0A9N8EGR4_9STRA|nr:Diacetyl reductase [(S)-acetoin forming] [Seminavis robusta]|eukprot:Sro1176_g249290.1 Diacetyl reductase [(S)-acetoin forming] (288) ;mRNA; r:31040-31903